LKVLGGAKPPFLSISLYLLWITRAKLNNEIFKLFGKSVVGASPFCDVLEKAEVLLTEE